MTIAFVGKGGSGKTTLASLFGRFLAATGRPVFMIDADINQHLSKSIGGSPEEIMTVPALGESVEIIKSYLRGSNSRIHSNEVMYKTTPPGKGSRLVRPLASDPLLSKLAVTINNILLTQTGALTEEDLGMRCYHSKIMAVEMLLSHMADQEGEYVITDMTAGADAFASGLFTKFDLTVIVVEPTVKSLSVYQQYKENSKDYGIALKVIANKIEDDDDRGFIKKHVGDDLLGEITRSSYIRRMEKGQFPLLEELEDSNKATLVLLKQTLDSTPKDWKRFQHVMEEFHRKNADSWMSARAGVNLSLQIDPDYDLGHAVNDAI